MKLNLLDRAIAAVAPAWAAERVHSRARIEALAALPSLQAMTGTDDDAMGGAVVSPQSRRWSPRPRDARSDTLRVLPLQRGASRELARTSPIAVGAINTNVDRVVGTGLALSPQPNVSILGWTPEQARNWKSIVSAEFSLWADSTSCDIEDTLNFYQLQGLVLRSALESGDCFTLMPDDERTAMQPYALRLQVLEADRFGNPGGGMDTPDVSGGIKLNAKGAPTAAHLYDVHPGGLLAGQRASMFAGQWVDFTGPSGRRRLLQHFRKLRPGMTRGVPYLAPIIDGIKQISRYTNAEIMAAVITAYLTVFIETPSGSAAPVFDGAQAGNMAEADISLGMGTVVGLAPGEKPHTVNPGRPNPNFEPFILAVIKQMGIALGLPYELLIKQFNSSFSASKAALLDAWVYFRGVRFWLALSFCQPVYETWLTEAVAIGRVPAPGFFSDPLIRWAYTRAAWPGDSMGSINPKDEVAAYVAAIDARLMTRERAEWELFGSGWDETYVQKLTEFRQLKEDGMLPTPKAGAAAPDTAAKPVGDQPSEVGDGA
ncbi:phage portal protein [Acidovorax sp. SUPP2825]|uniref:phage portal protein n=1 Tax=Acidovorax sp. SUPP2825 TaxID=2920879 RepID=UPI0023DE4284|nr:phage portal protein [Acidovorax sp. SUPP2825]GKS96941.1 phage portal protein [Acidovorax sp. SUPP2825]